MKDNNIKKKVTKLFEIKNEIAEMAHGHRDDYPFVVCAHFRDFDDYVVIALFKHPNSSFPNRIYKSEKLKIEVEELVLTLYKDKVVEYIEKELGISKEELNIKETK